MSDPPADLPPGLIERERRRLFRNIFASALGQGGVIVFGLGAMMLTTRLLGPAGYGTLTVFFMALGVISQVALNWPNGAVVRFGRPEMHQGVGIGRVLAGRLALYAACGAAIGVLIFAFRPWLESYLGLGTQGAWLLFGYALLLSAVEAGAVCFQTLGRFRTMAVVGAGVKLSNFVLLAVLFLAVTRRSTPDVVLVLHLAALAAVLAAVVAGLAWSAPGTLRLDFACLHRMVAYSWPALLGGIAGVVIGWVDTAVLRYYRPLEEVGTYGAAYQVVTVLDGLRVAALSVVWPMVMSLVTDDRRTTLRWYLDEFLPSGTIMAGCALAALGMACEAMPLLLGREFGPSVRFSQILVVGVAFGTLQGMVVNVASAHDRVRQVTLTNVAIAVANLAGDLALAPRLGPAGAALSTAAAQAIGALLMIRVVNGIAEVRGDAPGRRYWTALGLLPAAAVPALSLLFERPAPRLAVSAAAVAAWCAIVRRAGWFRVSALDRLQGVDLPAAARWTLARISAILGRDP
jgi:O-antigen/teichoic acid export membrane protein